MPLSAHKRRCLPLLRKSGPQVPSAYRIAIIRVIDGLQRTVCKMYFTNRKRRNTVPPMAYEFEQLANGSLVIKNVEVMTTLAMDDRPELKKRGHGIDMVWLKKTLDVFEARKTIGKLPFLMRRHNKPDREAEVIGRLDNLHLANDWIVADVLVTNPEAIEKIKRGEMPTRSAEFAPSRNLIWGLSLIEGQEGHFDSKLPELVLEELVLLKAADDICHETLNRTIELKEQQMPLTDEDLVKLGSLIDSAVEKAIDKKLAKADPKPKVDPKPGEEDIEGDVALAVSGLKDSYNADLAKLTAKNEVDTYIVALNSKGVIYTDNQLRKLFAGKKTTEGRKELFLRLQLMTNDDIKLEIDNDDLTVKHEDELKQEFAEYKAGNPKTTLTEQSFIELVTGQNKVNLSGKHVTVVT